MSPLIAITVFAVVFPAELPDKTMVAALVLGTRFRPGLVWCGIALAFAVHVTIAVAAGGLISLLPHDLVVLVAATLFLVGAVVLIREPGEKEDEQHDEAEIDELATGGPSMLRVVTTGFVVVFVAEWGDLTQILTASLAARYHDPVSVWIGAFAALAVVGAIGVFAGRSLLRFVPVDVLRRIAAGLLVILAILAVGEVLFG